MKSKRALLRRGWSALLALAATPWAACGSSMQVATLTPSPSELQLAQASWEAAHEASDGVAVTYSSAGGTRAVDATLAARSSCWLKALGGQVPGAGQVTSADSNFTIGLTFSAATCQIGSRHLVGSQNLNTFIHVVPAAHLVYLQGDWTVGLKDGRGWHSLPQAGQARLAQMTDVGGSVAAQHFQLVLRSRRLLVAADGSDASATVLTVASGVDDPTTALDVQEAADTTDLALAATRSLNRGTVVVANAALGMTGTHQVTALRTVYTGGCQCPQTGSMQQTVAYASGLQANYTYTFQGCGEAQVSASAQAGDPRQPGYSTVSWEDCR